MNNEQTPDVNETDEQIEVLTDDSPEQTVEQLANYIADEVIL